MTSALETMRGFIAQYPDFDILEGFTVDYTDNVPDCAGLFPSGLVELRRRTDLLGTVEVDCQCNFALYTVMAKSPDEDAGAVFNAEWQMGFQEWVQEQSALGLAPTFGDLPRGERITAQNGVLYSVGDDGTAMYVIQIEATYTKVYEREG